MVSINIECKCGTCEQCESKKLTEELRKSVGPWMKATDKMVEISMSLKEESNKMSKDRKHKRSTKQVSVK